MRPKKTKYISDKNEEWECTKQKIDNNSFITRKMIKKLVVRALDCRAGVTGSSPETGPTLSVLQ